MPPTCRALVPTRRHALQPSGPPSATGDVKCWGRNEYGQLGLGSIADVGKVNQVTSDVLLTP
jgi:hypothetical protein